MAHKITAYNSSSLCLYTKKTIKFCDNIEFTVAPIKNSDETYYFQIENIKGDLEITAIKNSNSYNYPRDIDVEYNSDTKTFNHQTGATPYYSFDIVANVNFKKVYAAIYRLQIPYSQLQCLKLFEYFEDEIILPGLNNLKFTYSVTRTMLNHIGEGIEVCIKNPLNARIQGKTGDYKFEMRIGDIKCEISFVVESTPSNASDENEFDSKNSVGSTNIVPEIKPSNISSDSAEKPLARKITVAETGDIDYPPKKKSRINSSSKWYEIMSNQQYSDVTLISSDNIEIPSHRCILAKYSPVFEKIIAESTELPVKINVENFDAETIQSALGFLYDKIDSIDGNEMDVFKFTDRYVINDIMDACCSFFEESVNPSNVCEFIHIAYTKNFEELKRKCLKLLVEKKKEIDPIKWNELPKNIIMDAFCL